MATPCPEDLLPPYYFAIVATNFTLRPYFPFERSTSLSSTPRTIPFSTLNSLSLLLLLS